MMLFLFAGLGRDGHPLPGGITETRWVTIRADIAPYPF
jgi:hypothetical protein